MMLSWCVLKRGCKAVVAPTTVADRRGKDRSAILQSVLAFFTATGRTRIPRVRKALKSGYGATTGDRFPNRDVTVILPRSQRSRTMTEVHAKTQWRRGCHGAFGHWTVADRARAPVRTRRPTEPVWMSRWQ